MEVRLLSASFGKFVGAVRIYHYVGPEEVFASSAHLSTGEQIRDLWEFVAWFQKRREEMDSGLIWVDASGRFYLAPRRSEHVSCARGGPVRAAGEMAPLSHA